MLVGTDPPCYSLDTTFKAYFIHHQSHIPRLSLLSRSTTVQNYCCHRRTRWQFVQLADMLDNSSSFTSDFVLPPSPLYPVWINADYFYWAQCTKCDNWLGTRNLRIMLKKQIPQIPPPSERGNVFSPSHFSDAVFVCYKKWKFAIRVIFVVKVIVT